MKKRCSKNLSICLAALLLLGSIICATPAFAEPKVSLIGTILAPGEKGGVNAYVLWTQAQKWHFNIQKNQCHRRRRHKPGRVVDPSSSQPEPDQYRWQQKNHSGFCRRRNPRKKVSD